MYHHVARGTALSADHALHAVYKFDSSSSSPRYTYILLDILQNSGSPAARINASSTSHRLRTVENH